MVDVPMKICPMCGRQLTRQSKAEAHGNVPDWYCPTVINPKGGNFFHYRESVDLGDKILAVTMIVPPYRVINSGGQARIGERRRYKTGKKKYYFKTIYTAGTELPPRPEEKMLHRIKTVLVMS